MTGTTARNFKDETAVNVLNTILFTELKPHVIIILGLTVELVSTI